MVCYIHTHIYTNTRKRFPTHLFLLLLELGQALLGLGGQRALRLEGLDLLVVLGCWGCEM